MPVTFNDIMISRAFDKAAKGDKPSFRFSKQKMPTSQVPVGKNAKPGGSRGIKDAAIRRISKSPTRGGSNFELPPGNNGEDLIYLIKKLSPKVAEMGVKYGRI